MTDLHSKLESVKSKENFLERIARIIPGYDGYVNRDNSRELDTILRNTLATKLDANSSKIKNVLLNLSSKGKLFETDGLDKLDKKLQQCVAKFKSAARGYSGAFDVVKVKEDKLEQLYAFDSGLLENVENISSEFAQLENNSSSGIDLSQSVNKLNSLLDELIRMFDERENILNQV
ncbi:MAG: hypothetical protein N2510_03325 [Ignavibacteria bacterium]|nr:hypothetical protein [Ignavibacteria bacterium]